MGAKRSASSGKDPPRPLAQQAPRREPPAPGGLDAPGHEVVQRIGLMASRGDADLHALTLLSSQAEYWPLLRAVARVARPDAHDGIGLARMTPASDEQE